MENFLTADITWRLANGKLVIRRRGVAQLGSAFGSGPKGRRFESGHPDRTSQTTSGRDSSAQAGTVRGVPYDWSLDLAIAPDGALRRIAAAINRPKKRAFGVLKTENEFVGFIRDDTFDIWERQGRAIHGLGTVRGRRGGSRVEVRLALPRWRKALVGVFFALYVLVAAGIATQPPRVEINAEEVAIALGGAALLAAIFAAGAAQQRSDLRRFLERIFEDVPRI